MRLASANQVRASAAVAAATCLLAIACRAEPQKSASTVAPPCVDNKKTEAETGKAALDVSKPYGYHLAPILDRIHATAEQRQKLTQVVQSYRSTIQPLRDQYKEKQQEFITSMISGGAAETVLVKQSELGRLSSEITSKYCLMRLEIRRYLQPQQILLFESYGREHGWNK